jgi:DNA-binding IclR family transcriptional regulator
MSRNGVSSVTQAIRLLKSFSEGDTEIGITMLAKRLNTSKSTAYRLASALASEGLLEQNKETEKYRLGIALFGLGTLVRSRLNVSAEGRQSVIDLREATDETVHLAILDGRDVIYVYDLESKQAIRMHSKLGARKPALCTAEGLAMLAFEEEAAVAPLIEQGFEPRTPTANTSPAYLRAALAQVQRDGFAQETEQCEMGMRSIAAPIFGANRRVAGAIGLAGPMQRLSDAVIEKHVPFVLNEARIISRRLGYDAVKYF